MKINKSFGQIVIEVLISIALFSLVAFSIATVLKDVISVLIGGVSKIRATYLTEEGLEGVWAILQENFDELEEGIWDLKISGGKWELSEEIEEKEGFLRKIFIEDVEELKELKKVKVELKWKNPESKKEENVSLSEYFTNLKDHVLELNSATYLRGTPPPWTGQNYTVIFSIKPKFLSQLEGAGLFASQDTSESSPSTPFLEIEFDGISSYQVKIGEKTIFIGPVEEKWSQLAVTWNGTEFKTYYNGQLQVSQILSPEEGEIEFRDYILGISSDRTVGFAGFYKNLMIFERTLNDEEIANLFSGNIPSLEGLKLFWKINEGEGNTIKDYSLSNVSGTITGLPLWEDFLTIISFEEAVNF